MKYLYKYPQAPFPYGDLVATSRSRTRDEFEYELLDTGVFDENRYFDVFVEYAKESPEDILIQITVHNRGPEAAELHLLPTLWFRNQWSWEGNADRPSLQRVGNAIKAVHPKLSERYLYCEGSPTLLFTENETNTCAASSAFPTAVPTSRTVLTTTSSMGRRTPSTQSKTGRKHQRITA